MGISFRGLGQVASRERLRMILSLVNFTDLWGARVVKVYSGGTETALYSDRLLLLPWISNAC